MIDGHEDNSIEILKKIKDYINNLTNNLLSPSTALSDDIYQKLSFPVKNRCLLLNYFFFLENSM